VRAHAAVLASLDLEIEQASDPAVYQASAPAVSGWSVKDHLEHLSIVSGGLVRWIERACAGDPELDSGGSPKLIGRIVLLVGLPAVAGSSCGTCTPAFRQPAS